MTIPSWLLISQLSGSGDTRVTITADTYYQIAERIASLLISGHTKHVEVEVRQSGTPIGVTPDVITLGSASTHTTVSVTSVEPWEMSGFSDDTWLTWSQTAGTSGNTVVSFTATTNSTGLDRVAHVNFCSSGICVPLTVTQTVNDNWDVIATYEFTSNGSHKIVNPTSAVLEDVMSVDGVVVPLASAITAEAGVHTVMFKSAIDGVLYGTGLFYGVQTLGNVVINDSITDLIHCDCLCGPNTTGVTLSSNLKTINKYGHWTYPNGVFDGGRVSSIDLPASLEYIGKNTFAGMNYLTGLTIPSGCYLDAGALSGIFNNKVSAVTHTSKFSITIPNDVIVNGYNSQFGLAANAPLGGVSQYVLDRYELVDHVYYAGPFALCLDDYTLTDYTVRDGTKFIEDNVFGYYCTNISALTLPNTVESIGGASMFSTSQTGITFTNGRWESGSVMILRPTAITDTTLTIPNNIKVVGIIGDGRYNTSVKTINIPSSVKYLDRYAFVNFKPKEVVIDSGVKYVASDSFYDYDNNTAVTAVTVPNSVVRYDMYDYYWNASPMFRISRTNVYNDSIYFRGAINQTDVTIPSGVKTIASFAFWQVSGNSLTAVTIPNTVKEIGYGAFTNAGLTSVVLPDSVEYYKASFTNCSSLSSITYSNNIKVLSENIGNNGAMTTLTIPDGVEIIDGITITSGATSLTTINLGSGVKVVHGIGTSGDTPSLSQNHVTTINCYATSQPKGNPFGENLPSGGVLHYPRGADYSGWESLATNIGWTAVGDL